MPIYKKKRHAKRPVKSKIDDSESFQIKVHSNKTVKEAVKPKIITGNKENRQQKVKFLLSAVAFIVIVFLISLVAFPVGVIETFSNFASSVGTGEYPINLSGSNVLNVIPNDNYYYVLTDMSFYAVSNSGKQINTVSHGYSKPVIKASKTRALVYDQGQKTYSIFTVKNKLFSKDAEFDIISADISDSGYYALASLSDSYASTLSVYDKNGNSQFTFNCAKETINNVSLSPNGKRVAISTVFGENGELSSKVYVFNIKNTDAEKSFEYTNNPVYSLFSNNKGVFVVSNSNYDFYYWKSDKSTKNTGELSVDFFRNDFDSPFVVLNRMNDRTDNTVILLSKNGEEKQSFTYNGNISDIRKKGSHIYLIGDGNIEMYDLKGKLITSAKCSHDYRYLISTGSRSTNLISDNSILKTNIK